MTFPSWSFVAGAWLVAGVVCCAKEKPACAPEVLAGIEVAYVTEAKASCEGFTFDTCPALPGIREKYRAKRAEWEHCK